MKAKKRQLCYGKFTKWNDKFAVDFASLILKNWSVNCKEYDSCGYENMPYIALELAYHTQHLKCDNAGKRNIFPITKRMQICAS